MTLGRIASHRRCPEAQCSQLRQTLTPPQAPARLAGCIIRPFHAALYRDAWAASHPIPVPPTPNVDCESPTNHVRSSRCKDTVLGSIRSPTLLSSLVAMAVTLKATQAPPAPHKPYSRARCIDDHTAGGAPKPLCEQLLAHTQKAIATAALHCTLARVRKRCTVHVFKLNSNDSVHPGEHVA